MGTRVFTASWGQLEKAGSNVGDEAIFASQVKDLSTVPDLELGVMSAMPEKTEKVFGAVPFDVSAGRLSTMREAVKWADVVIVGGGELAQDRSSLMYTPYNLMPLRMASRYGKPAYAWSVGIGQEGELARWTPWQLRKWMGYCSGVTARDARSLETLLGLGLDPEKVKFASDSAFTLTDEFTPSSEGSDILGVAIRNVSNRKGRLLPLELRIKLGIHREPDMSETHARWAALMDSHIEERGGGIEFFPFHMGSLSNSDDAECQAVMARMKYSDRAEMVTTTDVHDFMKRIGRCRVFVTIPLHGAILSVVTGTVPVSMPYASKGWRFMEQAGLEELTVDIGSDDWDARLSRLTAAVWDDNGSLRERVLSVRDELAGSCRTNLDHFLATCITPRR